MEGKPLVTSKQKTAVVCGVPTQVVCTAFSSHILVVVTQLGKMGTLVSLEPSSVTSDIGKPVLTTKVLLGKDEVMWLGRAPSAPTLSGCGASGRQAQRLSPPASPCHHSPRQHCLGLPDNLRVSTCYVQLISILSDRHAEALIL